MAILGDQLFDRDPNCWGPGNTSWLSGSRCQAVNMATRVRSAPIKICEVVAKTTDPLQASEPESL